MPTAFETLNDRMSGHQEHWLVTGAAGFIGSHLVDHLLRHGQKVTTLDNLSTGYSANLEAVKAELSSDQTSNLNELVGDLADWEFCQRATEGVNHILHQGALGSVPRSIEDPVASHHSNVTGTLNIFAAAQQAGVKRVVYASSSSVYGDEPSLPKVEERTGNLLSPYAATKSIAEVYSNAFSRSYGMEFAGLRYFNVFGPRQDPEGPYAAVIPIWVKSMLTGQPVYINGDGETSRDFTYVANVVQANLLAATAPSFPDPARAFNVAIGGQTSLNTLFNQIREALKKIKPELDIPDPVYRDFRAGDVRHSLADYTRAREELGFEPTHDLATGLDISMRWYVDHLG